MDAIGRREKQEMLRAIAYEMQAGEDGLKGNAIDAGRLTQVLTNYLKEQGFSESREKANLLIDQLRHRNFILCDWGSDIYGFVHRTFLEYFCAVEIVHRFEKQRTLTFEQLRDEVFGNHWQDETWHEVLRLICGAIDARFSGELIVFLMDMKNDLKDFKNLFLASNCLLEVESHSSIEAIAAKLIQLMRSLVEESGNKGNLSAYQKAISSLSQISKHKPDFLDFFQKHIQSIEVFYYPDPVMEAISQNFDNDLLVLSWLKSSAQIDQNWGVQSATLQGLALTFKDDPDTLPLIQSCLNSNSGSRWVKRVAANLLAKFFKENTETFPLLSRCLDNEQYEKRGAALGAIAASYKDDPDTLHKLRFHAQSDPHEWVRSVALFELSEGWKDEPKVFDLLCEASENDPFFKKEDQQSNPNPRQTSLQALLTHYPTRPKTLELLRDRAINDPDEQLREWAEEQLKVQNVKLKMEESSDG